MEVSRSKLHFCDNRPRTMSKERKESILDSFGWVCQYCDENAVHVDHVIPWSYSHDDSDENLVASCMLCNLYASNKVFDTFADKKYYILNAHNRLARKGWCKVWCKEELDELGPCMQQSVVAKCVVVETWEEKNRVQEILDQYRLKTRAALEYMLRMRMNVEPLRITDPKTS